MSSILFSHSYFLRYDPKQWEQQQPYAPLGTIWTAAWMRKNGYSISLFDTMFAETPDELTSYLQKEKPDFFVICDDGFNYLTKMCLSNMQEAAFKMAAIAKSFGCIVIASSSDSTDHRKKYLENGIDFVIIGEVEQTLLELTESLKKETKNVDHINGLAYLKNELVAETKPRNVLRELDTLPLPAWDLVDIERYRNTWMKSKGYFSINVATTRGCPYKCNWCAKPIYGNRYNSRSPENVAEELKLLTNKFKADHIWFCDDIFGLKPEWISDFSKIIKQDKLKISYKIQSRADLLVQDNYVADLAASGCETVWMGAESGSQRILDAMDKGITTQQIQTATALLKQHGIRPALFLQFGYLGETMEDIDLTIKMLNRLLPEDIGVSVSYPLPGTKFYEKVKEDLKIKTNWTDSDEMALMFKNTYSARFYKQLHRFVHKNYRKHQGYESVKNMFIRPKRTNYITLRRAASLLYYIPSSIIEKVKLNSAVHE